ncbi:cyclin-domain-containing protein, partial [Lipomyces oligophaga]|uniref:cyclin-domain-containing protein n=1 Tax=Lipomyces oligophaga TaxID=45792 RepID=UPI0034CD6ACA
KMVANMSCLFWFTPSQTLVHCSSSSQLILLPVCVPTPEFRAFVSAILSRTQVSRSVVALALLYIYRLKLKSPAIVGTPGSEYRIFTTGLVLANKFLDDNTYTNKTWAQVSKLPVNEIGIMELEFLKHICYDLLVSRSAWADWGRLLAVFVRVRKNASFACLSNPSSPIHATVSPINSSLLPPPSSTSTL